jgi:hypothetical protein
MSVLFVGRKPILAERPGVLTGPWAAPILDTLRHIEWHLPKSS